MAGCAGRKAERGGGQPEHQRRARQCTLHDGLCVQQNRPSTKARLGRQWATGWPWHRTGAGHTETDTNTRDVPGPDNRDRRPDGLAARLELLFVHVCVHHVKRGISRLGLLRIWRRSLALASPHRSTRAGVMVPAVCPPVRIPQKRMCAKSIIMKFMARAIAPQSQSAATARKP